MIWPQDRSPVETGSGEVKSSAVWFVVGLLAIVVLAVALLSGRGIAFPIG